MQTTIDILLCIDNKYVMPCGVTILSICENNKSYDIHFHIIENGVSEDNKKLLRRQVASYDKYISFYSVDISLLKGLPILNRFHISIYFRLLMADFLPCYIDRVLYLDSDLVVRGDIGKLWRINMDNIAMAAVLDQFCDDIRNYNRTKIMPLEGYINSGVLFINLNYWRKYNIGIKCIDWIESNKNEIEYPDQDALNAVLHDKIMQLPFEYNVQAFMYYKPREILARTEYVKQMIAASMKPCILHYTLSHKPWCEGCEHPFANEFIAYKEKSLWANEPLIKKKHSLMERICNIVVCILETCKLKNHMRTYTPYRCLKNQILQPYAD